MAKKATLLLAKTTTLTVEIHEHHSSMGTSHSYAIDGGRHYGDGVPVPDDLEPQCGQRYLVSFKRLAPNVDNLPERNPFKKCDRRGCQRGTYPGHDVCGPLQECKAGRVAVALGAEEA